MATAVVSNTLLPLTTQAVETLKAMAADHTLRPSMLCHEDHGEVRGWVLDLSPEAPVEALPIPSNLFHGVTVVRCEASEADALALMQAGDATRQALSEATRALSCVPIAEQASWERCRPCRVPPSLYTAGRDRDGRVTFEAGGHVAILDGAAWAPELSPDGFVGLYFLWSSSSGRLELYAACQSYLPLACAEFARMVFRLRGRCRARFVAQSCGAARIRTPRPRRSSGASASYRGDAIVRARIEAANVPGAQALHASFVPLPEA
jgi:hypothetical protein